MLAQLLVFCKALVIKDNHKKGKANVALPLSLIPKTGPL